VKKFHKSDKTLHLAASLLNKSASTNVLPNQGLSCLYTFTIFG